LVSHVVTGGAGFVATCLIARLLQRGDAVIALDDLSRGERKHWAPFAANSSFQSIVVDCADLDKFRRALQSIEGDAPVQHVWHLAANSDIPAGIADPTIDLRGTFFTTFNTLVLMRELGIPALHFASSSAIYGDLGETWIGEDSGPLEPISNYGAMKLASEAQIRAAVEAFLSRADIFRFPNVVGVPATHGVILDFVRKLKRTPDTLEVLGNGTQMKAYIHVEELVDAMLFITEHATGRYNVFNIGPRDAGIEVRTIAELVRDRVSKGAAIKFGESGRGWVGDVPRFRYSTERLAALGWRPRLSSEEVIRLAVEQIAGQEDGRAD
jgi:UDP-glucose 4-epimerase